MKSIFHLVFLVSLYVFGASSALQIHDSLGAVSVEDALTGNDAFLEAEKPVVTKTGQDLGPGDSLMSGAFTNTQTSDETTSTKGINEYKEKTVDTHKGQILDKTLDVEMVKTSTGSEPAVKTGQAGSETASEENSSTYVTENYTVQEKIADIAKEGYKDVQVPQQTSVAQTDVSTETKHKGFDGEGFLKAVSKLVNIRKRVGTPVSSTSVTTQNKSQEVDSKGAADSTKRPSNNNDDQDDDGGDEESDKDSFFDKYGIPEYAVWIVVYTVPILVVLLLCLTSYCCCCRR